MRILLLTDNFVPEINSPAKRAFEHARSWVRAGHEVTVITSIPNFPTGKPLPPYKNRLYQREAIEGIKVVRVWTFLAPNSGVFLRSVDFLSFALAASVVGLFELPDVIVASSPQLLTGMSGWWLAAAKRRPWVLEVRDLWPDSIVAVGVMRENAYIRALRWLERRLYVSASRIVTVSDGLRKRIIERGVPANKVGVVPNGVEIDRVRPRPIRRELQQELSLNGRFVAGYIGTHGMAQGLEFVLAAADRLRNSRVSFLFVGEGACRKSLLAMAEELKLEHVRFVGLIPSQEAAEHLALCDVILIPLRRSSQIEITIPAKIFEAAAMEKPMIVAAEGASATLIERYGAGITVPPEDPDALASAIVRLEGDPVLLSTLRQGCRALARDFDRGKFASQMLEQLALISQ